MSTDNRTHAQCQEDKRALMRYKGTVRAGRRQEKDESRLFWKSCSMLPMMSLSPVSKKVSSAP